MTAARSVLLVLTFGQATACSSVDSSSSHIDGTFQRAVERVLDHQELISLLRRTSERDVQLEVSLLRHIELVAGREARRDVEKYLDRCAARLRRILEKETIDTTEKLFQALKSHWLDLNIRYDEGPGLTQGAEAAAGAVQMLRLVRESKGKCGDISGLYLCLAERFNLPLFAVVLPEHMFLRIQMGDARLIFEATLPGWGRERTEQSCARELGADFRIPKQGGLYFRSLSKREAVLATIFDEMSALWGGNNQWEEVIQLCGIAQEVFGPDAFLHKLCAALCSVSVDDSGLVKDEARLRLGMKYAERHLEISPNHDAVWLLLLLGTVKLKDEPWSRVAVERVLKNHSLSSKTRNLALHIQKEHFNR